MQLQRIARRDKKVFLSDQCKEIEENNRSDLHKTEIIYFNESGPVNYYLHIAEYYIVSDYTYSK